MKPVSILFTVVGLTLSIATGLPAFAQSSNPSAAPSPTAPTNQRRPMHHPNFLNLTPEQQAKIQQIREATRSQIDAVLTPEQKAKLQQMHANRQTKPGHGDRMNKPNRQAHGNSQASGNPADGDNFGPAIDNDADFQRGPFAALNLTADQRTRIRAIMQSSKQQMDAVLTPEQRTKLQQMQQQRRLNRQQGRSTR